MKNYWTKPSFELMFALSLIAIMALPPLVFAQNTRNMDITIINGDTTINGKNIKSLSEDERKQALKDIGNLSFPGNNDRQRLFIRKRGLADTGLDKTMLKRRFFHNDDMASMHNFFDDSTKHIFKFKIERPNSGDSTFTFNYKLNMDPAERYEDRDFNFRMRGPWRENFHRRNTQNFEYTYTGSDGISTRTTFRVSDASTEKLKNMAGNEKAVLELKDLNLVAEFSSGKTLLLFSLPSKLIAEVKLTDSEGKLIWSEKAMNGNFSKSFLLGLNGVYFLQVKQGKDAALKRIVKEE
jgi:hypothetical protein